MGGYTLKDLRSLIDRIDSEIIELLRERMRLCIEVGKLKESYGIPVVDPKREAEVLRRAGEFREVFEVIIKLCREVQGVRSGC